MEGFVGARLLTTSSECFFLFLLFTSTVGCSELTGFNFFSIVLFTLVLCYSRVCYAFLCFSNFADKSSNKTTNREMIPTFVPIFSRMEYLFVATHMKKRLKKIIRTIMGLTLSIRI